MPSILDLYSGCGGFSLGAHQAGFTTSLAIDSDTTLSSSFPLNFPKARVLHRDMRSINGATLKKYLPKGVDGVIGGPPCQAFSEMGRRDRRDPRRRLVVDFFRIVALIRPKFFAFENVPGLEFPGNVGLLEEGLDMLPRRWSIVGPERVNAAELGAPTKRTRLFVFGFDTDKMEFPSEGKLFQKVNHSTCVSDAIGDLMTAGLVGYDGAGFDFWKYDGRRAVSPYAKRMRSSQGKFTGHRRTEHTSTTLKRFSRLGPGEKDIVGKYVRLCWDGFSPTLRAGTGNDRGSYQAVRPIHPVEDRVVTAREAARLQGFPDKFLFHPTVWHSCRMIGNSVSPIVARCLLKRIARYL
jgi:DNA (cytosine-5)-methyltransferase 1